MARPFAIVVFGATGITGSKVAAELAKSVDSGDIGSLAVAGRNHAALQQLVDKLGAQGRMQVISGVDVNDYDAVLRMARSTKLLLNCAGPYRLYGEPVVRACVEAGTHCLDVCGEPEFIERMEFKYGEQARAAGCYIASACGYDSMPADFGTLVAQRQFTAPAVPCSAEAYMQVRPGPLGYKIHYATWHSAVLGIGSVAAVRRLRAEVKAAGKAPAPALVGPKPRAAPGLDYSSHPAVRAWHLPFPGADASVVRRTQSALTSAGEPAVHFTARFTLSSKYYAYVAMAVGAVMTALAKYGWGRWLLLRFPGFFSYGLISHQGPSEAQMASTTTTTTIIAKGYAAGPPASPAQKPDKEVVVRVHTPDPGYNATSIFLVQAGLSLLLDGDKLPKTPGVYTGAALLRDTSYVERLRAAGVRIEVA